MGLSVMKILIVIILVIMLAVAVTLFQGGRYKQFMASAGKVQGVVTSKETRVAEPKTKRVEYWVTFSYDVEGSNYIMNENVEYPDVWDRLREGQVETVYYDKEKPQKSSLAPLLERRAGMADKFSKH